MIQTEDSAENSLVLSNNFYLNLNGKNKQTIDLPYIDTIPYLNLTDSAGVHLKQEFQGSRLDGVENIIFDGDTLYTEYDEVYVGHDGVIDGNYRCYNRLYTNGHNLKVKGDYHQYGTTNVNQGSMEITGNYTAHKSTLEMRGEKFHVHGNVKIGKEAGVNMYGGKDTVFLVEGDYLSSSRSHLIQDGTSGVLELKGDLIQNESAHSIGMDATNMTIIFSGRKTQKSTVLHVFGEVACIDMRNSAGVDFGGVMLQARQIKGLSRIKNNEGIVLWKSRVTLEENETVNGELFLCDTYLDCNGYRLRVSGSVEQSGGVINLNHGRLHTDGCYSIMGNGILQMIQAEDVLRVDGDFTTESTMSHATMLTNGRMELGKGFNQSGHTASFGSSGKFTIAFMGSGEHKAHFDNIEYSKFANIDAAHDNVVMDDEAVIATGRMLFSIGKGFLSGLQEALGIEELNAAVIAFSAAFGIAITAVMAIIPAAIAAVITTLMAIFSIISSSFMAAQAVEGIYNTATGTGTSYQKAEAYAHDAALLLMSIGEIVDSGRDILNNLKHLDFIFAGLKGRKTRVDADELVHSAETKTVKTLYSFDDFVGCMQDYLDADSLKYVKQELGNDRDNLTVLNKAAEAIQKSSRSMGDTKLNKTDIAFGLNKLHEGGSVDDAVETMVRCSKAKLNRYGNFHDVLEQQGITLDQFDKLKQQNAGGLEAHEIKMMRAIRESIPNPTSETCLRKTIPYEDIKKYTGEGGYNTIQGYVARDGDVSHIEGYKNVRESLRLDYVDKDGKMPYPPDGNAYGYIKFYTDNTGRLKIAFGKKMGGTNTDGAPCTGTGFLGSTNDEIIPEWKLKNLDEDGENLPGMKPKEGAEVHEVIDGHDYIVGVFRGDKFDEIPRKLIK